MYKPSFLHTRVAMAKEISVQFRRKDIALEDYRRLADAIDMIPSCRNLEDLALVRKWAIEGPSALDEDEADTIKTAIRAAHRERLIRLISYTDVYVAE